MATIHEKYDVSLTAQLHELKTKFDQRMLNGESFEEVKKIYLEIKRLEVQLNGISKFLKPW